MGMELGDGKTVTFLSAGFVDSSRHVGFGKRPLLLF